MQIPQGIKVLRNISQIRYGVINSDLAEEADYTMIQYAQPWVLVCDALPDETDIATAPLVAGAMIPYSDKPLRVPRIVATFFTLSAVENAFDILKERYLQLLLMNGSVTIDPSAPYSARKAGEALLCDLQDLMVEGQAEHVKKYFNENTLHRWPKNRRAISLADKALATDTLVQRAVSTHVTSSSMPSKEAMLLGSELGMDEAYGVRVVLSELAQREKQAR